ncbi:MAG TPA: MogA/MoaB family molybdenum cofactor biosynthesis protein [Deltaproteobacteria bacterium]|nr:MogA/MoaB family molybdenum cofactor biosynthesis protein [Deltaproteobacteria bacterium]
MALKVGIITVSDRGARGEREDRSGPVAEEVLTSELGAEVLMRETVPDEVQQIKEALLKGCRLGLDLIVTTGGTGVSPRDVTPEATKEVIERELPGFSEAIRMEGFKKTPHAIISRGLCGLRGKTLIVNLPGSPKAVREGLQVILPAIPHTLEKARGDPGECATEV